MASPQPGYALLLLGAAELEGVGAALGCSAAAEAAIGAGTTGPLATGAGAVEAVPAFRSFPELTQPTASPKPRAIKPSCDFTGTD